MTLRDDIRACTLCDLHTTRTQAVPFIGHGRIALVGEAPGAQEDKLGVPFMGPAGRLLDDALQAAGLSRSEVATLNTICCRPRDNKYANAEDVGADTACRPWFWAQIEESNAWIIVLAGAIPLRIVSKSIVAHGAKPPKGTITELRGKPWWFDNRLYLPTFHPSYVLRMGGLSKDVGQKLLIDLRLAKRLRDGDDVVVIDDWGSFEPLMPLTWAGLPAFPIDLYSTILGEQVTIADTLDVESEFPVWTVAELARMQADPPTTEQLQRIAKAKRLIKCEVI